MKLTSATDAAPTVDPLPIELNSDFNRHPTPLPATALDAELSEAVVPCLTDRRNAARKAAREAQVREYNQPFAQN